MPELLKQVLIFLPLETPKALLDFLTKEHKSDTYVWNDSKGNLVGFFSLIDIPNESAMEVLNIGIDPEFQRLGYGKRTMVFAERLAKKVGKKKMKLVTNVKNLPAVEFYKSIGYIIVKKAENYYGDGETRFILEKRLR